MISIMKYTSKKCVTSGNVFPASPAARGSIMPQSPTMTLYLQLSGRMPSDVVTKEWCYSPHWLNTDDDDNSK